MFLSQVLRVLNYRSRCHACKIWSVKIHSAAVTGSVRSRTASNLTNKHSLCAKSVLSVWNGRQCSSDSKNSTILDEERQKLRNDPEIKAWMNQIAQDFETAPFKDLIDRQQFDSSHSVRKSSDENVLLEHDSSDIEIEEFGYFEDDHEDFADPVAQERNVPISLQRGQRGVFDVEEIVAVLEDENAVDIQVLDIPPEARFVDHMVVVSGKSLRHMRAMAASIEWLYKRKKKKSDKHCQLEGRDCRDWLALDLGNIAVHIFTPEARQHYDLETLWTLGPEHDDPRHYVHDDSLNLSAADLFWLESGSNNQDSPHTPKDAETATSGGREGDASVRIDSNLKTGSDHKSK